VRYLLHSWLPTGGPPASHLGGNSSGCSPHSPGGTPGGVDVHFKCQAGSRLPARLGVPLSFECPAQCSRTRLGRQTPGVDSKPSSSRMTLRHAWNADPICLR